MVRAVVVDAHEDIAFNDMLLKRDFLRSAHEKRNGKHDAEYGGATIGLPDLLKGNVRIVFATLWVAPCGSSHGKLGECYETAQQAHDQALRQLEYYRSIARRDPRVTLVTTKHELERVVKSDTPRLGIVILMEGADPILNPEDARNWFGMGVRIVGPAWRGTRYAGGTGEPGRLTELGHRLLGEMEKAGFILDVSHLAEASFHDALEVYRGPIIASHSNCREYAETSTVTTPDRHLSDDMIREFMARHGVIGTLIYNGFLERDWETGGKDKSKVTFASVAKQMVHLCELAGNTSQVGIGSDVDGGFGFEGTPKELDTVADFYKIGDALSQAGLSETDIKKILGRNWLRVLREALPG